MSGRSYFALDFGESGIVSLFFLLGAVSAVGEKRSRPTEVVLSLSSVTSCSSLGQRQFLQIFLKSREQRKEGGTEGGREQREKRKEEESRVEEYVHTIEAETLIMSSKKSIGEK